MSDPIYTLSPCGKKLVETKSEATEMPVANMKERKGLIEAHIVKMQGEVDDLAAKIAKAEELGYTEE